MEMIRRELAPVSRETLQSKIYGELQRGMMGGIFVPGESISLRRLAEIFGTSMMPVREAVSRLIAERALDMLPNRTAIVPEMTQARFRDLAEIRVMLEAEATRKAAAHIAPGDVERLALLNDRLLRTIAEGDLQGSLAYNRDFHFAIYAASGSPTYVHVIERLWMQVGPFLFLSMKSPKTRWTAKHHLTIVEALRARDADLAARAVVADIRESADHLLEKGVFAER